MRCRQDSRRESKGLQQLADTEIERQNTVVDIGQTARETKGELGRVKALVEANGQRAKQPLAGNGANLKQTVDVEAARIKEAGQ